MTSTQNQNKTHEMLTTTVVAAIVSAALMYFFDPDTGAKRRAWVVQKLNKGQNETMRQAKRQAQHLQNKAQGAAHVAKKKVSEAAETISEHV